MTNPIENFFTEHPINEKMIFRNAALGQKSTLRGVAQLLKLDPEKDVEIVGSHTSKSILLPVVKYHLPNGSTLIVRDNFHNYAVSVESIKPMDPTFLNGFSFETRAKSPCYFEGFPVSSVFGSFVQDPKKFSSHTSSRAGFNIFLHYFANINSSRPEPQGKDLTRKCEM